MNILETKTGLQMLGLALVMLFAWSPTALGESLLAPAQEHALIALAHAESISWVEMSPEQAQALHAKAEEYLDLYQANHLPHGLNADVWWTDYDRSGVKQLEGLGDSAAWTGHYLAALALRHHVTKDPKTLKAISTVLEKFELLTVISGREGYIARYAGPIDDAGYQVYYKVYGKGEDPERPGLGKRAFRGVEPYTDLVWLGYSSRDTYDGVNFGLAMTLAYVDDPDIRAHISRIVERVADRLIADEWSIPDGKGNTTRATPWYKTAWMRTILSVNPEKYGHLQAEYDGLCERLSERWTVSPKFYREYFANNLRFIRMAALAALEKDPAHKKIFDDVLRGMFDKTADHLNAFFAAVYLLSTGDKDHLEAKAVLQGMLTDFPAPPKFGHSVDHRGNDEIEAHDDTYTVYALLARDRVPDDFQWQRSPCAIQGSWDLPYELPGIDVFLPYWMGRVAGVIPAP